MLKIYDSDDNFMIFDTGMKQLAQDKDLVGVDMRVFLLIASLANHTNKVCSNQDQLGLFLGINRSQVSKSIRKLNEREYLIIIDRVGKQNVYMLNPEIIFKGHEDNRAEAIKEYNNPLNFPRAAGKRLAEEFFNLVPSFSQEIPHY